jgi:multiple sugar transport system ATP-binding protein
VAAIQLQQLVKRYPNGHLAVQTLDLEIRDGEFLVLVGPSGCGKSTTLRMIAGLEEASEGRILIDGKDVTQAAPAERDIAMVFQNYALYPHMSVRENMAFGLRMRKLAEAEIQRRVDEAAAILGVEDLLDRRPREMSGGQRQRVALGRAIVRQPKAFLFDEPLSNLDAKLRVHMRTEIARLHRRLGTTMIYVTHDQVEAMGLGDRIAVMHKGTVRQIGSPREVYRDPADTFVASFLGSPPMNLIDHNGILLGFRPECFLPSEALGENGEAKIFQFQVTWIEDLGAERLVYGRVDYDSPNRHVISRIPANIPFPVEAGKTYSFGVLKPDFRFFSRDTGLRMDEAAW